MMMLMLMMVLVLTMMMTIMSDDGDDGDDGEDGDDGDDGDDGEDDDGRRRKQGERLLSILMKSCATTSSTSATCPNRSPQLVISSWNAFLLEIPAP